LKFTIHDPVTRSQRADAAEDAGRNRSEAPTIGDVIAARYRRRDVLRGALGCTAIAAIAGPAALAGEARVDASAFRFEELEAKVTDRSAVAPDHVERVLIRWGDPVLPGAPAFDPAGQTAEAQARQFGYNNDFLGLLPHPDAPDDPDRMLLVANHEYTSDELMFPAALRGSEDARLRVEIEMMAHGGTVIGIARGPGGWRTVPKGRCNRRITPQTPMRLSGPAAGHALLRTKADPTGRAVLGTLGNCAGGITPWGTWLMAEENFNGYFAGPKARKDDPATAALDRYGLPGGWYGWGRFHHRFDMGREPNEPNRFGWTVEVDPRDPASTPVKRTALGRFKHEGAATVVNPDGRVVLFSGDDERFEYVYRFVTRRAYDPAKPDPDMLDDGVLSVARYNENGTMDWLPLVHGQGPLTAANGFRDQGEVLVHARLAADLLGATPMDRPEDIEANPVTGRVYAMLTNNSRRAAGDENPANPRAANRFGHIVEMLAPGGDFAADRMEWSILLQCGDPRVAEIGATFSPSTSSQGWFGCPDNCAIDADGRLWVATDGMDHENAGRTDGLWAVDTDGAARRTSKLFYRVPVGAELCGPCFTPEGTALFLSVQHPGEGGREWPGFGRDSTFEDPSTRWPDFAEGVPPRPSVVVVTRIDGGRIAS
jgi:secreted PhoX family phosphatase